LTRDLSFTNLRGMDVYKNPEHWRERADEARATAKFVQDPHIEAVMLRIADEYEQLAQLIKERLAKRSMDQDGSGSDAGDFSVPPGRS
jgi:hypothetical protein